MVRSVGFGFLCNDLPTGLVESVFGGGNLPPTITRVKLARFRVEASGLGWWSGSWFGWTPLSWRKLGKVIELNDIQKSI